MLEINYGIIATVAAGAMIRCYTKFVRGVEPSKVDMSGKVRYTIISICVLRLGLRLRLRPRICKSGRVQVYYISRGHCGDGGGVSSRRAAGGVIAVLVEKESRWGHLIVFRTESLFL